MKLLLLAATAVAGYLLVQRRKAQQLEQDLWAEATDPVPPRDLR